MIQSDVEIFHHMSATVRYSIDPHELKDSPREETTVQKYSRHMCDTE